jgi:hypothetical protein
MGAARWSIRRRGPRLEVAVGDPLPVTSTDLEDLSAAVEPELASTDGIREVILDRAGTLGRRSMDELMIVIRHVGRLAIRYGKPFSVRPI